ncbi:hypothetical protein PRK78_000477 [Emydomyces testavorans]|uniref:Uncharacterized protein n=1 Tax=Emydomyces testavorans TaxID=2070801 RepID=A0AAF0IHN6_9EURO|nr:hypothetical protein PRK78_000477 [Emydomyces testavorans]
MIICLRPGNRILLGHRLRVPDQGCPAPISVRGFAKTNSSFFRVKNTPTHPYVVRPPQSRARRLPCPVPRAERTDISKWVPFLDRYLPSHLRGDSTNILEAELQSEAEQCQAILQLLFQARSFMNFDLLVYMGFKLDRWQAVRRLVDKLLDNAEGLQSKHSVQGCLPSNIDWKSMGPSFEEITGDEIYPSVTISLQNGIDHQPLVSYDSYSEEPTFGGRLGETNLRIGTMEELWQTLGLFIIEAADMDPEKSALVIHHFYYIVARLHFLDYIPKNVYRDAANRGTTPPLRPPAMHLLSTRIMSTLTDTILEPNMEELAVASGQRSSMELLRSSERRLGFGVWLEFILWCCVEGGYAREAAWIIQNTRNRSKEWKVASFARLLEANGPLDPRKIDYHDTWAQCGQFSTLQQFKKSEDPFLGLGARTISREVLVSVMDGLTNAVRAGVSFRGDSAHYVWERIGLLRGLLNRNLLYVNSGFINYLIVRILEAGGIVAEVKPQALDLLLNVAPSIMTADKLDLSFEKLVELSDKGNIPNTSAVILGLYHYTLNAYASSGHISGTIDVLEKLIGAVDYKKVHLIRELIMESKYLTKAHNVRKTNSTPASIPELNDSRPPPLAGLQLPASSLNLLLSTLTDSEVFSLASWILNPREFAGPIIPIDMYNDEVLSPAIIRFATATKDFPLVFSLLETVRRPWPRSTLQPTLEFRITRFRWKQVLELLIYLRDVERAQWEPKNVATLAATILRLDQPHDRFRQFLPPEDHESALAGGKQILRHMLEGEFDAPDDFSKGRDLGTQQTLFQFHRIFESIKSPSLSDVCSNVKLKWQGTVNSSRYLPADAFRTILAAVVEVYGSTVGQRLYHKWCMSPTTPHARRIDSGGNARLFYSSQLNPEIGGIEPSFDPHWHADNRGKLVMPDLSVVRVIALGALKEQKSLLENREMVSDEITSESVTSVLNWCIRIFFELGLTDREIDRELDGHLTRTRERLRW